MRRATSAVVSSSLERPCSARKCGCNGMNTSSAAASALSVSTPSDGPQSIRMKSPTPTPPPCREGEEEEDPSPTAPPRGEGLRPVGSLAPPSFLGKGGGGLGSSPSSPSLQGGGW